MGVIIGNGDVMVSVVLISNMQGGQFSGVLFYV